MGTLMAWFKPVSMHNGIVMAVNAPGTTNPADFALGVKDTGSVYCFFQQGGATQLIETPAGYYSAGQDIQAAVAFNDRGFALYVDGNGIGRTNTGHTAGFTNNALDWRFGNQHDTSAIFDGVIDDIAIWDRVLTVGQISQLAQVELIE